MELNNKIEQEKQVTLHIKLEFPIELSAKASDNNEYIDINFSLDELMQSIERYINENELSCSVERRKRRENEKNTE